MRSVLYQYKGCGDYELRSVLVENVRFWLKLRFSSYTVVPVPSHQSHNERRGFNHVYSAFELLDLPMCDALIKTKDIKQASSTLTERKHVGEYLQLKDPKLVQGKRILLVDDVYTTGSTIRACIRLLQQAKAKEIRVVVLSKTPFKRYESPS